MIRREEAVCQGRPGLMRPVWYIMFGAKHGWQDRDYFLSCFGDRDVEAKKAYIIVNMLGKVFPGGDVGSW